MSFYQPINQYPIPVAVGGTGTCQGTGMGKNVLNIAAELDTPSVTNGLFKGNATFEKIICSNLDSNLIVGTNAQKELISRNTTGTDKVVLSTSATLYNPQLQQPDIGVAQGTSLNLTSLTPNALLQTDGSNTIISAASTGTGPFVAQNNAVINTPTINNAILVNPDIGAAQGTSLNLTSLTPERLVQTDVSNNLISAISTGTGPFVQQTGATIIAPIINDATIADATLVDPIIPDLATNNTTFEDLQGDQIVATTGAKILTTIPYTGSGDVVRANSANMGNVSTKIVFAGIDGLGGGVAILQGQNIDGPASFILSSIQGSNFIQAGFTCDALNLVCRWKTEIANRHLAITDQNNNEYMRFDGITGKISIPSTTVSANKLLALNAGKELIDSPSTGTGVTVVLDTSAFINSPVITGGTLSGLTNLSTIPGNQVLATDGASNIIASPVTGTGNRVVLDDNATMYTTTLSGITNLSTIPGNQVLATDGASNIIASPVTGTGNRVVLDDNPTMYTTTLSGITTLSSIASDKILKTNPANSEIIAAGETGTSNVVRQEAPLINNPTLRYSTELQFLSPNRIVATDATKKLIDSPATGTGTTVVMQTSPTIVTPIIGAPTFTAIAGITAGVVRKPLVLDINNLLHFNILPAPFIETYTVATTSLAYTILPDASYLEVYVTGAGGGGGLSDPISVNSGSGGGGGNTNYVVVTNLLNPPYTVTVGAGGTAGVTATAGNSSSFNNNTGIVAEAYGGGGGVGVVGAVSPPTQPGNRSNLLGTGTPHRFGGPGSFGGSFTVNYGGYGGSSFYMGESYNNYPLLGGGGCGGHPSGSQSLAYDGAPGVVRIITHYQ